MGQEVYWESNGKFEKGRSIVVESFEFDDETIFMNLYPRFYSIIIRGALDCVLNSMCYCDRIRIGAIAQLGERFAGSEEVVGSIPSSSTKKGQWIQIDSITIYSLLS